MQLLRKKKKKKLVSVAAQSSGIGIALGNEKKWFERMCQILQRFFPKFSSKRLVL